MLRSTQVCLNPPVDSACRRCPRTEHYRDVGARRGARSQKLNDKLWRVATCREVPGRGKRRQVCFASGGFMGGIKKALRPVPRKAQPEVETPPFQILSRTEGYELRLYDVYPFVSTPYERRDEGYLALGAYMDGENSDSVKLNSTQPIVMRYEPSTGLKHMQLYVGSRKGDPPASEVSNALSKPEPLQHPPLPLQPKTTLGVGGGEVVAVRLFQGQATQSACMQQRLQLEKALENDGMGLGLAERDGVFRLAQYGPINSLSIRRNEIILAVQL